MTTQTTTEMLSPAELYEHYYGPAIFQRLAARLAEWAAPREGERVLDLACGTGFVAREIAPRLGPSGSVLAVDINPKMLEVGQRQPAPGGAPVEWRQGDAVTLDLPPETFDLAFCQQGLQFFSDRAAALRNVHRALAPGGRVALAIWQGVEAQSTFTDFSEVEAKYLGPLGVPKEALWAPFSLGNVDEVRALLEDAGFTGIEIEPHPFEARFADPEHFARRLESAYGAVIPAFVEDRAAFEEFLTNVERDTREIVERFTDGAYVRFPMPANFVRAQK